MPYNRDAILASVFATSLDSIIIVDADGIVAEFNPAAERTFGYTRDQAVGADVADLIIPPQMRDAHNAGFSRYLAGAPSKVVGQRVEVDAVRSDGSLFPIEIAVTEIAGGGEKRLFIASIRDLTEQRATQAALRNSEAQLTAFLDHAPASMYLKNMDDRYVVVNRFTSDRFGLKTSEMVGKHPTEILDAAAAAEALDVASKIKVSGQSVTTESTFHTPNGTLSALAIRFPVRDHQGDIQYIGGVILDTTERTEAERKLRDSEARLKGLLDHAPLTMYLKDRGGRFRVVNKFMAAQLGKTPEEIQGLRPADVLTPESAAEAAEIDRWIIANRRPHVRESEFMAVDGKKVAVTVRFPVFDEHGAIIYIGGVFLDLTDEKRAQEELARSREALAQSEKLTALGSLLAGVSHELNNPLAVVVGEAILLEEDAEGTEFASTAMRIRKSAERCSRIVQTFLAMARQKPPERVSLNVAAICKAAVELTDYGMRSNGIKVRAEFDEGLPHVAADSDQLHQVIVNLLVNAQQALQECEPPREIRISTSHNIAENRVCIEIADNGPGIPAEIAKRIFEPFFTTKPQGSGTGLGLSFSHGVVEAHGGTLSLKEGEGGAAFLIQLPISVPEAQKKQEARPVQSAAAGSALIADDEPELADALARFLAREGYETVVVNSGREAIAKAEQERFDVILSDLRMPDVDGPAFHRWLAEHRPEQAQRLGFVTGDTLGPAAVRFLDEAKRPYIEKPFNRESVRRLLAELRR
ncbi:PAS domain S-box protein [Sphingomonas piscis]|uniref:histidine kinase n=1 Tax=Sphingomonas piscis TaxID=2714943 RepID=A0A6G7YR08_9SPHN|nr:PAS domain S-box protein [Sphingomonas piscis]QIK79164.1 PAS domain S-box protein [Sphingomonas piscis]